MLREGQIVVAPTQHHAGVLERVKAPLAALAAEAALTRPARSRNAAIIGATACALSPLDFGEPPRQTDDVASIG